MRSRRVLQTTRSLCWSGRQTIRKECLFPSGSLRSPTRGPVSHAAVFTRWLRPGSLGQRAFTSVARDNPTAGNDVSVTPTFRQTVRAGGRGIGVHVPGPPCKPHGGDGRTARRVCAADVRCAGWLRSADPPALPRGSRPRFGRQQWVVCCARRRLTPVAPPATPDLSPRCEQDLCTSRHRGPDRSTVGGCGPVWYVRGDNLQLQTVTDARGAQTPPETVFRARNPAPRAVITALRAGTAAGDGVHNLATLATCPTHQR